MCSRARWTAPRFGRGVTVHEVREEVGAVSPGEFLRLLAGRSRGFWASGNRWVAHGGLAGRIAVENGAAGVDPARFRLVEEEAGRLFAGVRGQRRSPRLFGGFSFAAGSGTDPLWASFPAALFHLPEVEIEHFPETGSCSLAVRGASREEAAGRWREWRRALEGKGSGVGRGGGPDLRCAAVGMRRAEQERRAGAGSLRLPETKRAAWRRMVWQTLDRIGVGDAEKVVLARAIDLGPGCATEPAELATALWEENHGSHVFLFEPVPGEAVVGAAPETIATLVNGVVRATAVAGSAPVGADSVETAQLARDLFNSSKDRAEHDMVVRDMVARLKRLGCSVQRDVEPHVLALARIQHLETKIAAGVPPGVSLLDILASLHPTPAVCGIPRDVALSLLTAGETFDRGWYAGPVGWFDAAGKGIFVPALRSAACAGGRWRLFAGAGIVQGSDPALEWAETELKFRPVLRAIERTGERAGPGTAPREAAAGRA